MGRTGVLRAVGGVGERAARFRVPQALYRGPDLRFGERRLGRKRTKSRMRYCNKFQFGCYCNVGCLQHPLTGNGSNMCVLVMHYLIKMVFPCEGKLE